jgi:hypothetical protein
MSLLPGWVVGQEKAAGPKEFLGMRAREPRWDYRPWEEAHIAVVRSGAGNKIRQNGASRHRVIYVM